MKFGETLYQRSVPKWAPYNFKYNEIKELIKLRTTSGLAAPVPISGRSNNRWEYLEDELFQVFKEQYDDIALFLKSKFGELDRRLIHLEKQVRAAQKSLDYPDSRSTLQVRRYHRLVQESESIGEDIQSLSRFGSVQKTAFRKILKKYRKWTNSTTLQTRLENELFSSNRLSLDYAALLDRLATQSKIISDEFYSPMLKGNQVRKPLERRPSVWTEVSASAVGALSEAACSGPLSLDAALVTVPFGQAAGSAAYWIHPDNIDEARVLLLRHVRELHRTPDTSRHGSVASLDSENSRSPSCTPTHGRARTVYYDNAQRFVQDSSTNRMSKVALTGRWTHQPDAYVTLSDLNSGMSTAESISLKRKDLSKALQKDTDENSKKKSSSRSSDMLRIQEYLSQHRDVKPLAELHSVRSRYAGSLNSAKVGTWATLDVDIVVAPARCNSLGSIDEDTVSGEAFPHAVLEIRWEFGRTPEVVRAFDTTHLAERMNDFSLESAAIHTICTDLKPPSWKALLGKDIRKVPITTRINASGKRRGSLQIPRPSAGLSSATSSTDGPTDSVFSTNHVQSSATSEGSPSASVSNLMTPSKHETTEIKSKKSKRARASTHAVQDQPVKYWNEFDDGDSDVACNETYTIYVDPNESFPGVESITNAYAAITRVLSNATGHVTSWLPLKRKRDIKGKRPTERTHLLVPDVDADSSDSDASPSDTAIADPKTTSRPSTRAGRASSFYTRSGVYGPTQVQLSARSLAIESTLFHVYTGLLILSYILLFMSGVLLGTGRKKARTEVEAGALAGIITAEVCAAISIILIWMRRQHLGILHWGVVGVSFIGVVVVGAALLAGVFGKNV